MCYPDLSNEQSCEIGQCNVQLTPGNSNLQAREIEKGSSYREFELSRVKLHRK